jgi:hypothetical protein
MKTSLILACSFFLSLFHVPRGISQIPEWQDPLVLDLTSGSSVESAFSDGYGQHIIVSVGTTCSV